MAPGPKRKPGIREPNGRIHRPNKNPNVVAALNAMEREKQDDVMSIVQSQPHRREFLGTSKMNDAESKMIESPIGRFLLRNMQDKARREIYYGAAISYLGIVNKWRAGWGAQVHNAPPETPGTGEGPSMAALAAWRKQDETIRRRIEVEVGVAGWIWISLLVLDELEAPHADVPRVLNGLWIISTELGKLDGRLNKMA